MIDLYFWTAPNGQKITILLEEAGLDYHIIPVNLGNREQYKPAFLALSPNHHIPVIIDQDPADGGEPLKMIESGAILLYLEQKSGKFMPSELRARKQVLQWLFWEMSTLGQMGAQFYFFNIRAAEKLPYAIEHYKSRARQDFVIMDQHLAEHEYLAGEYSITDISCYPWVVNHAVYDQDLSELPNLTSSAGLRPSRHVRRYSGPMPRTRKSTPASRWIDRTLYQKRLDRA